MRTIRKLVLAARRLLPAWQAMQTVRQQRKTTLYINIGDDGSVKIGTCRHCVVREKSRPDRAQNANDDAALDFPRDRLIERLTEFGLQVEIKQEYVCP